MTGQEETARLVTPITYSLFPDDLAVIVAFEGGAYRVDGGGPGMPPPLEPRERAIIRAMLQVAIDAIDRTKPPSTLGARG